MIATEDKRVSKPSRYVNKLHGMKKYQKKRYITNLVVLRRHRWAKEKQPIYVNSYEPKHNFLKYWKIVRKWATVKYNITYQDLEIILYLYDEGVWKAKDFLSATQIYSWDKKRLERLIDDGWLRIFRDGKGYAGHARLYEMTPKGKKMCEGVYSKVTQEEAIPENHQNNPIFKKSDPSFILKMYRQAITKMNIRRTKDRLESGDYET